MGRTLVFGSTHAVLTWILAVTITTTTTTTTTTTVTTILITTLLLLLSSKHSNMVTFLLLLPVSVNKHSFCESHCLATQQQKLLFSPLIWCV